MSTEKKNLMLVIPSLDCGGAERVIVSLANALSPEKYDIVLVPLAEGGDYLGMLRPGITIHSLQLPSRWSFFAVIARLRSAYIRHRPDIVLSTLFFSNVVSSLARFGMTDKPMLIVCEHGYTRNYLPTERFPALKKWLIGITYRRADKVVGVSEAIRDAQTEDNRLDGEASVCIHNPVPIDDIKRLSTLPLEHEVFSEGGPVFLGVGRLVSTKRFDLLIEAFAKLRPEYPRARLAILGAGELLEELKRKAISCDVADAVHLIGFQEKPFSWYARSVGLIVSSEMEGFPMVLLEAMACGTPVISTDCLSGPSEIIANEVNGLLVPVHDSDALARAMRRLLEEPELRRKMVQNATTEVGRYAVDRIVEQYESLWE